MLGRQAAAAGCSLSGACNVCQSLLGSACLPAVGHVVMAKSSATGDPLAIKFHVHSSNRDISFEILKKLVNKVSRQYLVAPPAGMSDAEVRRVYFAHWTSSTEPCQLSGDVSPTIRPRRTSRGEAAQLRQ